MRRIQIKNFAVLLLLLLPFFMVAQTITGTVKNENSELLPYINVIENGATNHAITGKDGKFSLRVSMLPTTLIFESVGFAKKVITIKNTDDLSIVIKQDKSNFDKKLKTDGTTATAANSITYISGADLIATGKLNIEQALTYASTSFNSTNQTHANGSTHYDLANLHGLGASRVLVLVNGKRKNLGAIIHVNNTYARGEVGTDLRSVPTAAIDHIEILRDGASAKYGSDAIGGVINIILKKQTEKAVVNYNVGITVEGDGMEAGGDVNGTFTGKNNSYVNYTIAVNYQDFTNRAGDPKKENYFTATNQSWINENPELGMTIGHPEMKTGAVYFNGAMPFKNGKGELYASIGGEVRKGTSFAMYRTPYMNADPMNLHPNNAYQPTLETSIIDNMDVVGVKYKAGDFNIDVSGVFGMNKVEYGVENSTNHSITTPINFDSGTYSFNNAIGNATINRKFDKVNATFGAEYKVDKFTISQGEYDSWYVTGTESFFGVDYTRALTENRNSFAAFVNADFDLTKDFMFGASARYDSYSDVGDNLSYKANARYKIGEKGAVRASYGTSFRAPALQQIYANNKQYADFGGSSIILNETERMSLGIADLEAETATNMSIGFFVKPIKNLAVSLDYYKTDIDDRVVLTSALGDTSTAIHQILTNGNNNVASFNFFTNAINTETQGIDFSMNYGNIRFPKGMLSFDLGMSWNDTKIVGDVKTPNSLVGQTILNRTDRSRIETSSPSTKAMLGINYKQQKFSVSLNNTCFGEVTWQHATDQNKDQTFSRKVVTDVVLSYDLYKWMKINIIVNNALNVYPDEIDNKGDESTNFGGRFKYPYQLNQLDAFGTQFRGGLTFEF